MNLKCLIRHDHKLSGERDFFQPLSEHQAGSPGQMNERTFTCTRCGHKKTKTRRWHVEKHCKKCGRMTKHENIITGEMGPYMGQGDGILTSYCIICGASS